MDLPITHSPCNPEVQTSLNSFGPKYFHFVYVWRKKFSSESSFHKPFYDERNNCITINLEMLRHCKNKNNQMAKFKLEIPAKTFKIRTKSTKYLKIQDSSSLSRLYNHSFLNELCLMTRRFSEIIIQDLRKIGNITWLSNSNFDGSSNLQNWNIRSANCKNVDIKRYQNDARIPECGSQRLLWKQSFCVNKYT